MSIRQFDALLVRVTPLIIKSDTFRESLKPELRLLVTLRFLGTGNSYICLALDYRIGISTVQGIIKETCSAIWTVLHEEFLNWPDISALETISNDFSTKYGFPNCIGAIDGKHCRIQAPPHRGTVNFNFKKFHSIILLAVCDAYGFFIYVDIGAYGSQSDGGVFSNSSLGQGFELQAVPIPKPKLLPRSTIEFAHFIIGDEAFPLSRYLLRPYSGRNLNSEKSIFNDQLAKARNIIECSFGRLANRFRILRTEILAYEDISVSIVQACVVLHNYIGKTSDENTPKYSGQMPTTNCFQDASPLRGRQLREGEHIRDIYMRYICSRQVN